jgi:hypothetical protein
LFFYCIYLENSVKLLGIRTSASYGRWPAMPIIKVYVSSVELKAQIATLAKAQGLSMSEFLLAPVLGQSDRYRSLLRAEGALLNPLTYARLVEISQVLRSLPPGGAIDHELLQETLAAVRATARDLVFARALAGLG